MVAPFFERLFDLDLDLELLLLTLPFMDWTDLEFLPWDRKPFYVSTVLKWFIDLALCKDDLLLGVADFLSLLETCLCDKNWNPEFEEAPPPTPEDLCKKSIFRGFTLTYGGLEPPPGLSPDFFIELPKFWPGFIELFKPSFFLSLDKDFLKKLYFKPVVEVFPPRSD